MPKQKLIISVDNGEREYGCMVRVDDKANALLEDLARKTKRSKAYIASKMIEFAYEYTEISKG